LKEELTSEFIPLESLTGFHRGFVPRKGMVIIMVKAKKSPFEQAISYLGTLKPRLAELPRHITDSVNEIRIRAGQPVILECGNGKRIKLFGAGNPADGGQACVCPAQISECVREFCGHSIHSYEKQFKEGWLTLEGGHRAGFTGTAVLRDGKVENIRDISSVNLRIARQYMGCAEDLHSRISNSEKFSGLLIIGRPMSAKTTVLRDVCRLISEKCKIALIDERSEIAAVHNGIPALDVGENTDILNNFPKAQGIMTALRSLSPEYVVCDEIGWETQELTAVANSGIKMILTAHSSSLKETYLSARIRMLLCSGGISHIALLGHGKNIGRVEFYGTNKHYDNCDGGAGSYDRDGGGAVFLLPIENAGGVSP
jgi:stage III sporulation protein AA